jgi:hypothetical protein
MCAYFCADVVGLVERRAHATRSRGNAASTQARPMYTAWYTCVRLVLWEGGVAEGSNLVGR